MHEPTRGIVWRHRCHGLPALRLWRVQDMEVRYDELAGWWEQTASEFRLRMLLSTPFFIQTARALLLHAGASDRAQWVDRIAEG